MGCGAECVGGEGSMLLNMLVVMLLNMLVVPRAQVRFTFVAAATLLAT